MDLVIRESTENDIPSILNLLYELERPRPMDDNEIKIFTNKIQDYFLDSHKTILVSETENEIVGIVSIIYLQRLNRAKLEMYIPELIVTEKFRYSGVGKKMIQHCIDIAKKKGCYRIRLESGNQRKESHIFYKSIGFEQSALSFTKYIL
ncbi:MAG: GNAT family N-acetyltransferase [Nitrosopumilus sp.]|nr:GNAT family N-acetyltransferase [Nitrosopumilus sp.]MDH3515879.1 GNAT family N-acetyltransferase [Nitrosopumilus sp.]MDH3564803.1 GNAT family N-acetyltransferase [Nitrosopumilus sp.]MDH5555238.1 GNAT family N-acetyltransferase [Nitrosopumilus sp.]